ncbi:flagellar hook-basal body complex protein FliE [Modestobacter muralis]|uniref:Flagellar hook-basal body complex protein FliE n=1 Tax=Modestobacter muralis TaxID=1608614 RepID=A0A6P0EVM2_9ACTN|nr:flagellar hook-basal body complex protein FliE [Modestobacter muralis]NEK94913.1 flagellar hook-basal body complex protein FliE [Modestobacter muralis]NEN51801.1 flagellar hook-basal body complex protein FliE [Modestobacter muralis]
MTSPISAIPAFTAAMPTPNIDGTSGVTGVSMSPSATSAVGDGGFADILTGQIDQLNAVQGNVDTLALQAATGDLQDAHDYMIASTEARLATDTVVTLKNSAVAAFTEIMRMPV